MNNKPLKDHMIIKKTTCGTIKFILKKTFVNKLLTFCRPIAQK